ncbi:MAG: hypothetical protein IT281_08040 [Ignavibacteria bacterium]|nr:hypothetical protein [Ignavibacteria bacterium]
MHKAIIIFLFIIGVGCTHGQDKLNDSLSVGRYCNIVLSYGFQAEGKISHRNSDTVWLETDITVLRIPIKDIKFVLNSDFELNSEGVPEIDSSKLVSKVVIDTTTGCDVYLEGRVKLANMNLMLATDSTIFALKNGKKKEIKYSDVRKLVFLSEAPFGKGFFEIGAAGFVFGFLLVAFNGENSSYRGVGPGIVSGLICAIPAGLIGGIIYAMTAKDDIYIFPKGKSDSKSKKIKYLIQKHH